MRTWRRAAGVGGPVAFAAAWSLLGARPANYSPIHDPISRLAATGAPTRELMTAGLLAFGVGVAVYSREVRDTPGGGAMAAALTASAVASVGIALTPLDSAVGGLPHAAAVAVAYSSLAATPLLGAKLHRFPASSRVMAAACGASLLCSVVADSRTGLWQRLGLTIGHAWIAGSAMGLLRRRGVAAVR